MYYIVRITFTGETEIHSIEQRETEREALARYYNIITAGLSNNDVTFCMALLFNEQLKLHLPVFKYGVQYDDMGDYLIAPFQNIVGRIFINSNEQMSTSIEYKDTDEAYKRYFNILAADLQNENLIKHGAFIVNSEGYLIESRAFTRTIE